MRYLSWWPNTMQHQSCMFAHQIVAPYRQSQRTLNSSSRENVVYLIKSFSCYKIDTLVKLVEEWM